MKNLFGLALRQLPVETTGISGEVKAIANSAKPAGRTTTVSIYPIGETYTVGYALRDYTEWTRIARSPRGHYNNLVLINYHIIPNFAQLPLEDFTSKHLAALARNVLETPPRYGFMGYSAKAEVAALSPDELRRRKWRFNSPVSILRMAFQHAWDNGHIASKHPWHCLKRFRDNEARLQRHALANNLATFLRCIELPEAMADWSLTSLQLKLIKKSALALSATPVPSPSSWPRLPSPARCSVPSMPPSADCELRRHARDRDPVPNSTEPARQVGPLR